ncbi:MAG: hypothetical protein BAJALOKI2v1_900019 [Promethearchaeota archaeon]|nr:MAG: hypothetical protein BAJALOKI2v1_900019 [Candidatus Lokiarchaeota archaeon]
MYQAKQDFNDFYGDTMSFNQFLKLFNLQYFISKSDYDNLDYGSLEIKTIKKYKRIFQNILSDYKLKDLISDVNSVLNDLLEFFKLDNDIESQLEKFPDGKRKNFILKILRSPLCPKILKKIAANNLNDLSVVLFGREPKRMNYIHRFLGTYSDKDIQTWQFESIIYRSYYLTEDNFKRPILSRDYEILSEEIEAIRKHLINSIDWFRLKEDKINQKYLDISARTRDFVLLQYNTIKWFLISFMAYKDSFKKGFSKLSSHYLHFNIEEFNSFSRLKDYMIYPYIIPDRGIEVMNQFLDFFTNEALLGKVSLPIGFRQLKIYEIAKSYLIEFEKEKVRCLNEFEKRGFVRLSDKSNNIIEYIGNLFRKAITKITGWKNPYYQAFSHIMLFWESGGMGADGNLISDMFLSKSYTHVKQHLVEYGSSDPRRDSLALRYLVLIASSNHRTFETIPISQQKYIKRGIRTLFYYGIKNGEIEKGDFEKIFPDELEFDIIVNGRPANLNLKQIWEELNLEKKNFDLILTEWNAIVREFRKALLNSKNPYKAIIEGTPLEEFYEYAKRFSKTLFAFQNLLKNKDRLVSEILNQDFKPEYKDIDLFSDEFPNLMKEFVNKWYQALMMRSFNLDTLGEDYFDYENEDYIP